MPYHHDLSFHFLLYQFCFVFCINICMTPLFLKRNNSKLPFKKLYLLHNFFTAYYLKIISNINYIPYSIWILCFRQFKKHVLSIFDTIFYKLYLQLWNIGNHELSSALSSDVSIFFTI